MLFQTLEAVATYSGYTDNFVEMISNVITIVTSIFTFITGNWLLMGTLAIGVVVPIIFSVFTYFKNRH